MTGYGRKGRGRKGRGRGRGRGRGHGHGGSSSSSVDAPMSDADCIALDFDRFNAATGQCENVVQVP